MDAPTKPITTVQALNVRLRRIMLIAGLGLVAAFVGAFISGELNMRVQPKLIGAPRLVTLLVGAVIWRFWVLAVLPAIGYVTGRSLRLRPLSLAFGAALSGELFYLLLDYATTGFASVTADVGVTALRVATLAGGILLTLRATRAGWKAADRAQAQANSKAQAKKAEYAEMLRESERIAEKHATTTSAGPSTDPLVPASSAPLPGPAPEMPASDAHGAPAGSNGAEGAVSAGAGREDKPNG